jgi:aspartyl-tRNA(Asn)/glutamyl-tRNA(Gln) amidotransferase subunit A
MARSVADCAALLLAMARGEAQTTPLAPPPAHMPVLPLAARPGPKPLEDTTIALTDRSVELAVDDEIAQGLEQARQACERLGARVVELPAPWRFDWNDLSVVLLSEVWAYHAQFASRHDRYRPAIAELVEAARNFTDAQAYLAAQQRRARGTAEWEGWLRTEGIDFVLEPTLPIVPYARGPGYERGHAGGPGDPMIALTALWDMTGMPVASLPVAWNASVSLIGPRGAEATLTQAAIDLQEHALGVPVWPGPGAEA